MRATDPTLLPPVPAAGSTHRRYDRVRVYACVTSYWTRPDVATLSFPSVNSLDPGSNKVAAAAAKNMAENEKEREKTAIVLLVDGSEEMEAVIVVDVLRRAGIAVTVAGVWDATCVKCSRNVKICTDAVFTDATQDKSYDIVILPGGLNGSKAFTSSVEVGKLLQKQDRENKLIAAICAAPTALKTHNIGKGKRITSYPSMKKELCDDYEYCEDKVVVDGNLITSRGPATAIDFSLTIVKELLNEEKAKCVANGLLYEGYK